MPTRVFRWIVETRVTGSSQTCTVVQVYGRKIKVVSDQADLYFFLVGSGVVVPRLRPV